MIGATSPLPPLPLRSISHLSRVVRDIERSVSFYVQVLGFQEIKRPSSLECEGSWLFGYGIALHLIAGSASRTARPINPQDDHTSFTTSSDLLPAVEARLNEFSIPFVKAMVEEGGVRVTQAGFAVAACRGARWPPLIFFHCPDHHMIEVCNCDCLPVEPLQHSAAPACKLQMKTAGSCQLQHKSSPMKSAGSMELSGMHFDATSVRPLQTEAA